MGAFVSQAVKSIPLTSFDGSALRRVFSQAFKRHPRGQAEERFNALAGSDRLAGEDGLPRPWLFTRVLLLFGGSFLLLFLILSATEYPTLLPGVILLGSFTVPLALGMLALESDTPRGLTLFGFVKLFVAGAILAILFTTVLNEMGPSFDRVFGASGAALVEEPAKILAVIVLARAVTTRWSLNGLAAGAAVGAGFAAIESAGYALVTLVNYGLDDMAENLLGRSLASIGTHAVWTAVAAAALWRAARGGPVRGSTLVSPSFIGPFLLVMALHFAWNSPWAASVGFLGYATLAVGGAIVCLAFLLQGAAEFAGDPDGAHWQSPGETPAGPAM